MDGNEMNTHESATKVEPSQRPWVTPSFERFRLKEALSSETKKVGADGETQSS